MELEGWGNPGRVVHDKLHSQMFGIMKFLKDADNIGGNVWNPDLQGKIGETIDVNKASTVRHIIGFMKSVGILYDDALEGGKVPNPSHCITPSGEVLFTLINMEELAKENENEEVLHKIKNMLKRFYANAFIYWFVRDTKVHVARTVLKSIKQYGYLDKIDWFILNTFISETDNQNQEILADQHIMAYRAGELKITAENIKSNINSYNYWTQILDYAGLIIKSGNKIYIGKQFPELVEALLSDDFLLNLDLNSRYYLEM